jgi:hypothetical protein
MGGGSARVALRAVDAKVVHRKCVPGNLATGRATYVQGSEQPRVHRGKDHVPKGVL